MSSGAAIHDLGYRRYDGDRAGSRAAMVALGIHAFQRVMGLKRAGRHKILPAITVVIAFVPALVFVGMAAFLPDTLLEEDILPSYAEYNAGFITPVIFLFASFVAPEAICTDRRTGMMALYLASPLNRTTYIAAKVAAVTLTMLAITLLPTLFLLIAYTIAGAGPSFSGFVGLIFRITAGGCLIAIYYGAFSAMVSSFTPRKSVASAGIIISFLLAGITVGALVEGAELNDHIALANIAALPIRANTFLLGESPEGVSGLSVIDGAAVLAVAVALAICYSAVTWWRYQVMEVDR